jgi:Electron transfer flavoprotein domain
VAAVLVHIDLPQGDRGRADASSLIALAAGRALATSWGASLYAGVIMAAPVRETAALEAELVRGGVDRIVIAPTLGELAPLWDSLGNAWQNVLDQLRPRLVLFGADAPSADELAPRTAARIGARYLPRARVIADPEAILRDRDGGTARLSDGGAAVAMIGHAVSRRGGDGRVDVVVLPPADGDARVELVENFPIASAEHASGTLIALADDLASDAAAVADAKRLAELVGGRLVASKAGARSAGLAKTAIVEPSTPLAPELCVAIGHAQVDVAGATSVIKLGAQAGKLVDGALPGSPKSALAELVAALERAT